MTNKIEIILFIFAFVFFLSFGYAHSDETAPAFSSDTSTVPHDSKNQDIIVSSDESPSDFEEEDDFFAEFEEEYADKSLRVADPFAPWNRAMFRFNDKFYFWILEPAAKGYRFVAPRPVRSGVKNFFHNITTPSRLLSSLLQKKVSGARVELVRFFVNSTVGVLGFGDPAKKHLKLNPSEEDLGQTLGAYGIGNGLYLVWPFLGPSTLRDSVGMFVDLYFLNPVAYVKPMEAYLGITAYDMINDTSFIIGEYESLKKNAVEPYAAFRSIYIQHRNKKVNE